MRKTIKVVAGIIEKDDTIMIAKRSYGEFEGLWEFPGGKYEEGEYFDITFRLEKDKTAMIEKKG